MAKKSSKKPAEKPTLSAGEKALLEKYRERFSTATKHGWYTAIPQTDMLQLHAIYKRFINPHHTPSVFCGHCNMNVLKALDQFMNEKD